MAETQSFSQNIEDEIINMYLPYIEDKTIDLNNEKFHSPTLEQIKSLCKKAFESYSSPENGPIAHTCSPVSVVGDVHGNMKDLLIIFRELGTPATNKYMFIGDYVDRGLYSIPVICFLLALRLKYKESIVLIRGNHEVSNVNAEYGFLDDLKKKFNIEGEELWKSFNDIFGYLPLCCIIGKSIFCVHGGISPLLHTLDDISNIKLPLNDVNKEAPIVSDMLWSDPSDSKGYKKNSRGSGYSFGYDMLQEFLKNNKFRLLVRGHQVASEGVCLFSANMGITVFSSSNYNRLMENKCGVLSMDTKTEFTLHSFTTTGETVIDRTSRMKTSPKRLGLQRIMELNPVARTTTKSHTEHH